jgi:hypothetical protein
VAFQTQGAARGVGAGEITNHVAALRVALRQSGRGQRSVDEAAAPLIARCSAPLLRLCDKLARSAPQAKLEGEDLALHAWQKMLRYLAADGTGERVLDDEHFERLLLRAARTRLLDVLDQGASRELVELDEAPGGGGAGEGTSTRAERLRDPGDGPEALLLPRDGRYLKLVEELFADEERFRTTYRQTNPRHPRNYKALVLYQIGAHWREEVGDGVGGAGDPAMAGLIRHYVQILGVPAAAWSPIEAAAGAVAPGGDGEAGGDPADGLCPVLLAAVNRACGTNLRSRATLAVLRHEMNKFAARCAV